MKAREQQIRNFKKVLLVAGAAATLCLTAGCVMYVPDSPRGPYGPYGYQYGWYYPLDWLFYPFVFVDGGHGYHGGYFGHRGFEGHGYGGGGHHR